MPTARHPTDTPALGHLVGGGWLRNHAGSYACLVLAPAALVPAVVLIIAASALATVALASLRERLPRNRWAGVRTPSSLASEDAFRLANKVAGLPLLAAAVFLALGAAASLGLDGALRLTAVPMCVVAALVTAVAGGALGSKAASSVAASAHDCAPQRCATCTGCALVDAQS